MRIACTTQKTQEFFNARCGRVTASRVGDAMRKLERASGKKKAGDWHGDHDKYVEQLSREMRTGIPVWHYVTAEMDYGVTWEPFAREAYSVYIGREVKTTGVVIHPTIDYLRASPDGLVGSEGGVECKVPLLETHYHTLVTDEIPDKYLPQMYCNMLCCQREWWDFVSFCPADPDDEERMAFPDDLRIFVKRLYADQAKFREIEEAAKATIEEAVALVKKLSSRIPALTGAKR